jgi:hypothetical protein
MPDHTLSQIGLHHLLDFQIGLGAAAVAAYAYKRFGTPSTIRSTTTALRYHTSAGLYYLMALSVYLTLALSPDLGSFLAQATGVDAILGLPTAKLVDGLKDLSPALLAVIFMTVVLPALPFAKQIDGALRRSFQRMARIPNEVRRLSGQLKSAPYDLTSERRAVVLDYLDANGFASIDGHGDQEWQLWLKVTNLVLILRDWRTSGRYADFVDDYQTELQAILDSYDAKRPLALEYFRLTRPALGFSTSSALGTLPSLAHTGDRALFETRLDSLLKRYRGIFIAQCDDLLERICDFIGRAILSCNSTERARLKSMEGLGFRPGATIKPSADQIVLVYLILLVAVLLTLSVLSGLVPAPPGSEPSRRFAMLLLIPTVHCLAILWAVYPKDVWEISKVSEDGIRPYRFYLLVGGLAAMTAAPVSIVLWSVHLQSIQAALERLAAGWPILLLSSGTAAFTAFNLDNREGRHLRWLEGIGQGLAQMLLAFAIAKFLLLPHLQAAGRLPTNLVTVLGVPALLLAMSFVIGCVIGLIVPSMHRKRLSRRHDPEPGTDDGSIHGPGPTAPAAVAASSESPHEWELAA